MIQAIETVYNGYKFRSRLEARWALFFDLLGVRWEYEKEGYETPYGRYVPDFWLPNGYMRSAEYHGMFWEVKPDDYGSSHDALEYDCGELGVAGMLACGFNFEPSEYWGRWNEIIQIAPWWDSIMFIYQCRCGAITADYIARNRCEMKCAACGVEPSDLDAARSIVNQQVAHQSALAYRFW